MRGQSVDKAAEIGVQIIISNTIVADGLVSILGGTDRVNVLGISKDGKTGLTDFENLNPDVLILGLRLPDICAAEDILPFFEKNPSSKIIVYAEQAGDVEARNSLSEGASGFITPDLDSSEIVDAILRVYKGETFIPPSLKNDIESKGYYESLTEAEKKVLTMIVGGLSNKEIGFALDISENTVKTHLKHIFEKLQVSDRTAATVEAIKRGIVRIDV